MVPKEEVTLSNVEERLEEWRVLHDELRALAEREEALRLKIKIFMRQNKWVNYEAKNGVKITILKQDYKSFDEAQLRIMLTEEQYYGALKTKVVEKMLISTKDDRKRMSKRIVFGG